MLYWCSWVRTLLDTDHRDIQCFRQITLGIYVLVLTVALCRLPYSVKIRVATILPIVCAVISYCVLRINGGHLAATRLKVSCVGQSPKVDFPDQQCNCSSAWRGIRPGDDCRDSLELRKLHLGT